MTLRTFTPLNQRPLGGRVWSFPFGLLALVFLISLPFIVWRFAAGLGAVTALSDGYPWGLWIAFDVVTGTALASGGFAVALLVYILNRWRYHPLVRPAMVTAALGYTIAVFSLIVDVGRPWNFWKVPVFAGDWNLDSALLEVALCVAAYTVVLWIETSPALLEKWREQGRRPWVRRVSASSLRVLYRVLPVLITIGVLLPTMHQSSLGALMVLTGYKLHPLWQTPMLPLLFLVSSFLMGLGAVMLESTLANRYFRRPQEPLLGRLARFALIALLLFFGFRLVDVVGRGHLALLFALDLAALLFWIEMGLLAAGFAMLWRRAHRHDPGWLLRGAVVMLLAGTLYRFDAFIVMFSPGPGYSYFPSVPEILITLGFVALEVMAYLFLVRRYPVLGGRPAAAKE